MKALTDFFTTDYGILSAIVIFATICMLVWYIHFFLSSIKRDTENARKAAKAAAKAARAAQAAQTEQTAT